MEGNQTFLDWPGHLLVMIVVPKETDCRFAGVVDPARLVHMGVAVAKMHPRLRAEVPAAASWAGQEQRLHTHLNFLFHKDAALC